MNRLRNCVLLVLLFHGAACVSGGGGAKGPPPSDPIANVSASELRFQGLGFARGGDLVRAQQYLSASMQKGFEERIIVPELVKVCVAASRLRAALAFAEPYLARYPQDAGMRYVVGTIHLVLGNLREASMHLSSSLDTEGLMGDSLFSLALIAKEQGQNELVRRHLQKYLDASPQGRYASRAQRILVELGVGS